MNRVRGGHGVVSLKSVSQVQKLVRLLLKRQNSGGKGFAHKRKIPLLADRDAIVAGISDDFVLDVCESALCFKWLDF